MAGNKKGPNRWKGLIVGLIGGAVGTFAMGYYWQAVTSITGEDPRSKSSDAGPHELDNISLVGKHYQEGEGSTAALGREISESVAGKEPTKQTKELLSNQIHWTYGSLQGAIYGVLRGGATDGPLDLVGGALFGTAIWLGGSEIGVPLLGLAAGPSTQPLESHAYGLGAHIVYGLAVSTITQVLYRLGE